MAPRQEPGDGHTSRKGEVAPVLPARGDAARFPGLVLALSCP